MYLEHLSLINYKNFEADQFTFDSSINCLVGRNGSGKTTILDAIYHLAFTKSYFNPQSTQNVRHGAELFTLEGKFKINEKDFDLFIGFKKGTKKTVKLNGKTYERISDHIGKIPLVIISPADQDLISEGSETRRKFIDSIISQSDSDYLNALLKYNQALSQRNSLLKYFANNNVFQKDTLALYDELLIENGSIIFEKRNDFLNHFSKHFIEQYKSISPIESEIVEVKYDSELLKTDFKTLLERSFSKDRLLQYTSAGIHKDDLMLLLNGYPIKKFGSQGQQKSFLIALRFAQYAFLKNQKNQKPIVLLDDIFDKLDDQRVMRLVALVENDFFGQLFISDTNSKRTEEVVKATGRNYVIHHLE
ncbi:MAG: DNA replication and repair protein RecF [Bacteroidetes bacterium]|nr:MAG: DNA replication and repair protein RecF [Bacteroidota bacterium]